MNETPESNPRLDFFRTQVGQSLQNSISPFGRWLRGTLRAVDYGSISVEFRVREGMTNPAAVLHGGAVAGMMDEVIGMMVFGLGREYAFTSVNLNCDFLHAARQDDTLTVHARVVRAGRNIVHCECQVETPEGTIIAKSTSNLIQTSVKLPH